MNNEVTKIPGTDENWENGTLGCDARYAKRASPEVEKEIDDMLGFGRVSLRLPLDVIQAYKILAVERGYSDPRLMMIAALLQILEVRTINA